MTFSRTDPATRAIFGETQALLRVLSLRKLRVRRIGRVSAAILAACPSHPAVRISCCNWASLTSKQRALLDKIWNEYLESGKPLPRTRLHVATEGGATAVHSALTELGGYVVFGTVRIGEDPRGYSLTLLGALLTHDGEEIENTTAAFHASCRRIREDPRISEIASEEWTSKWRY